MAAAGGGAGYVRLQTPESGISQATQFWGAQEAKRVGDKKLAEERQGVRDDEALKTWEDTYDVKAGEFESKYTGFKSFDDMTTDFSLDTTSQYVELQRQAKEAMLSGNTVERSRLQGEMIKVKGAFKEASKSQTALGEIMVNYRKAVSEGRVSMASKDFEDIMQAGFQDMNIAMRYRDGQVVYTGLTKEGKIIVVPQQDIMDGSFSWTEKQDLNGEKGIIKNLVKNLGTITKDSYSGYTKTTSQVWDEKLHGKAADLAIESLVGSDDVMTDLLAQVTQGKTIKRKDFTDKDYETVKDSLKAQVKGGYTESVKKDFESGKYGTDVNAALTRQKMADDRAKKTTDENVVQAEPVTTMSGGLKQGKPKASTTSDIRYQEGGEYTLRTQGGKPIKGVIADDSDAEVLSIKRSEGGYSVQTRNTNEVSEKDTRSGSTIKKNVSSKREVSLTDEEANRLARMMGLDTAADLDTYLKSRDEEYLQKTNKKEETLKW